MSGYTNASEIGKHKLRQIADLRGVVAEPRMAMHDQALIVYYYAIHPRASG